jgi:hypothetical protein
MLPVNTTSERDEMRRQVRPVTDMRNLVQDFGKRAQGVADDAANADLARATIMEPDSMARCLGARAVPACFASQHGLFV